MATMGHGQFPLCTYVRNFKHRLLKPVVRIENGLAGMVISGPSTKIDKEIWSDIRQKT